MPIEPVVPRLLFVEDDPDVSAIVADLLRDQGFEVLTAARMDEGVAWLERHDVQLVLADFLVDASEPWAALERLRDAARPAPVGLVTGWSIDEEDATGRGYAFLLRKPFDAEELYARVGAHVAGLTLPPARDAAVRAYFDALGRKDFAALAALCTGDVRYHVPGGDPTYSRVVAGRREFQAFADATFRHFPDARFDVQGIVPLPEGAVGRYTGRWKDAEGTPRELPGSVTFHFRGDAIAEIGVRLDVRRIGAEAHPG